MNSFTLSSGEGSPDLDSARSGVSAAPAPSSLSSTAAAASSAALVPFPNVQAPAFALPHPLPYASSVVLAASGASPAVPPGFSGASALSPSFALAAPSPAASAAALPSVAFFAPPPGLPPPRIIPETPPTAFRELPAPVSPATSVLSQRR